MSSDVVKMKNNHGAPSDHVSFPSRLGLFTPLFTVSCLFCDCHQVAVAVAAVISAAAAAVGVVGVVAVVPAQGPSWGNDNIIHQ